MYTYVAKSLVTVAIYKCVLKSLRLKLDSQLLRGGNSSCSLWSELQVMES